MKPRVHRWTRESVPAPWEYWAPIPGGSAHGHVATWQQAFDRTLQLIAEGER